MSLGQQLGHLCHVSSKVWSVSALHLQNKPLTS